MRIIKISTLQAFFEEPNYRDAKKPLEAWVYEAKNSSWKNSEEIKIKYRTASILNKKRVVFNIHGNKYRLVVEIHYRSGNCYIRFIGTHEQYNKINAETV